MLLILMYHRIYDSNNLKKLELFKSHLRFLSENYPIVLPGDVLPSDKLSICLTFDDAYFDFYCHIFPLLKEFNIRAVLGVPAKYIIDNTTVDHAIRLNVPYDETMKNTIYSEKIPFCTWQEIREMADSNLVEVASHSYSHASLIENGIDFRQEVIMSKEIIEEKISKKVNAFIFPYGKVNKKIHSMASKHYAYLIRIGSALNKDWHNSNGMIYRVNGDNFIDSFNPLNTMSLLKYYLKYLSNSIRRK